MGKIIDNVLKVKAAVTASAGEAARIQGLAQEAILRGSQSTAWETYMMEFCDKDENGNVNADQLMRLLAADGSELDRNRAYLVANAMCGSFTRAHFEVNVQSVDAGMAPTCAPTGT